MSIFKLKNGVSLIEALIAMGLFFVFATGAIVLTFRYLNTIQRSIDLYNVETIATESMEAVYGIAYDSWASMVDGTYGLDSGSGSWEFDGSPDLIDGRYTRTVAVSSISRDVDCILDELGTADPDSKQVAVTVEWPLMGSTQSRGFSKLFTNWRNPIQCPPEPEGPGGQAGGLGLDVGGAFREEFIKWWNFLVLIDNIVITNISDQPVTVDKVQVFMDEPSMRIFGFYMDGSKRWGWFGPGSPGGSQYSGTELNVSDYEIDPGEDITIKMWFFTSGYGAVTFSINFIMEDGTEIETDEFTI